MSRPFPPARIEYETFELRPIEPFDVPQITEALTNSLSALRQYMAWSHYPLSQQQFLERVLQQRTNYFKGVDYELGMFDKTTGEFLLYTGFYPSNRINPKCMEIGYWASSKHKGKGLTTLAAKIQIVLLFEYFKCDRIEITCHVENGASLRVIEKCGFQHEGELRNFYPQPSLQMVKDGFVEKREAHLFALISEDRPKLAWYPQVCAEITVFPLLGEPIKLSQMSESN